MSICPLKGQMPVGLVLLKDGVSIEESELEKELISRVRETIGPVACFKRAIVVNRLPKTRSGKIMRRILRKIAEDDYSNLGDTSTLADPSVVHDLIANRMK